MRIVSVRLLAGVWALCVGLFSHAAETPTAKLKDLDQFRAAFNRDLNRPRLVLLMSPT